MSDDSVARRVLARLFGVGLHPPLTWLPAPPTADYSVARRTLAGLFGVRLPVGGRATTAIDASVETLMYTKTPITNAVALLSSWDVSKRLYSRGHIMALVDQLKIVERRARGLDQAFATNQALGLHDSILRAHSIGDFLANASAAAERLVAADPRAAILVQILDRASRLTDLFAQGQGFGDGLARDAASASAALMTIANDFLHADVRGVNLSVVLLVGVRWDAATRWPPEWIDRIQRASEEDPAFPGVFVVQAEPKTEDVPVRV